MRYSSWFNYGYLYANSIVIGSNQLVDPAHFYPIHHLLRASKEGQGVRLRGIALAPAFLVAPSGVPSGG